MQKPIAKRPMKIILRNETTSILLSVIVADRNLNNLFTGIMMAMIVFNTINMGGQLDLQIIKEVFKRPVGPIVGLVSQFLIMPLVNANFYKETRQKNL